MTSAWNIYIYRAQFIPELTASLRSVSLILTSPSHCPKKKPFLHPSTQNLYPKKQDKRAFIFFLSEKSSKATVRKEKKKRRAAHWAARPAERRETALLRYDTTLPLGFLGAGTSMRRRNILRIRPAPL